MNLFSGTKQNGSLFLLTILAGFALSCSKSPFSQKDLASPNSQGKDRQYEDPSKAAGTNNGGGNNVDGGNGGYDGKLYARYMVEGSECQDRRLGATISQLIVQDRTGKFKLVKKNCKMLDTPIELSVGNIKAMDFVETNMTGASVTPVIFYDKQLFQPKSSRPIEFSCDFFRNYSAENKYLFSHRFSVHMRKDASTSNVLRGSYELSRTNRGRGGAYYSTPVPGASGALTSLSILNEASRFGFSFSVLPQKTFSILRSTLPGSTDIQFYGAVSIKSNEIGSSNGVLTFEAPKDPRSYDLSCFDGRDGRLFSFTQGAENLLETVPFKTEPASSTNEAGAGGGDNGSGNAADNASDNDNNGNAADNAGSGDAEAGGAGSGGESEGGSGGEGGP